MNRFVVLTTAGVVAAAVLAAAQVREGGPRPVGTGVLSGRVIRTDMPNRVPAARIVVTLDANDGRSTRQTISDDDGRFAFDGLAAGRYGLRASKVGWVTTYYGSPRAGHPPGVRVAVADGARVNVEIPIVKGAVIAGRIVDRDGRPMARAFPWLLEQRLVGDRKMLTRLREQAVGSFEQATDDLGEFRLFGLAAGTYYLVVNPSIASGARVTTEDEGRWALTTSASSGTAPPPGPIAGYASMYFPGTPDPGAAQGITVGAGEVREGLEFRVGFVNVARVEGLVQGADGTPVPAATIRLADREPRVSLEGSARNARSDPAGRFVFQNVPPGDYRLSVRASSTPGTGAPAAASALDLWGQSDVVVSGQDVQGVGITLAPAATVSGRLTFMGTTLTPPADLQTVRLQLTSVDALATALSAPGAGSVSYSGVVNRDGSFRVTGLPPDRYLASASWPGMRQGDGLTGWWLTAVSVGGRDIGDRPIEVDANRSVADVGLEFRDRIGAVEGTLTDASGAAAPAYFVLAFPADRASWTTTSRRVVPPVQSGTDGRYRLVGLLPGEYYLAVVTEAAPEDTADPEFLASIVPGAVRITVRAGDIVRRDLRIK